MDPSAEKAEDDVCERQVVFRQVRERVLHIGRIIDARHIDQIQAARHIHDVFDELLDAC